MAMAGSVYHDRPRAESRTRPALLVVRVRQCPGHAPRPWLVGCSPASPRLAGTSCRRALRPTPERYLRPGARGRGDPRAPAGRRPARDPGRDPLRLSRGRAAAGRGARRAHRPARASTRSIPRRWPGPASSRTRGAGLGYELPAEPGAAAVALLVLPVRDAGALETLVARLALDRLGAPVRSASEQGRLQVVTFRARAGAPAALTLGLLASRAHRPPGAGPRRPGRRRGGRVPARRRQPGRAPGLARAADRAGRPARGAGCLPPVRRGGTSEHDDVGGLETSSRRAWGSASRPRPARCGSPSPRSRAPGRWRHCAPEASRGLPSGRSPGTPRWCSGGTEAWPSSASTWWRGRPGTTGSGSPPRASTSSATSSTSSRPGPPPRSRSRRGSTSPTSPTWRSAPTRSG